MANNNTGGCVGGILQLFGGMGMLLLTCARMGDDMVGCASAASKFDDIGRTGSRVYYPANSATLSKTYTRYADDAYAARAARSQTAIKERSSFPSSLIEVDQAIPTVIAKRSITARPKDYSYEPLRALNMAKDIPKLFDDSVVEESDEKRSAADNIAKMHKRLLASFCEAYMLRNPHFNKKDKDLIVKGIKKAGNSNFSLMKNALIQVDKNILDLEKSYPEITECVTAYKHAVSDNFLTYLNLSDKEVFDLSTLSFAHRDSGFAVFLELTERNHKRERIIKRMLRQD